MALRAILQNSAKSPVLRAQSSTSIIRSLTSKPSLDQPLFSGIDQGSQKTALFDVAGIIPKQSISQNSAASSVMNSIRYMSTTNGAHNVIGRSALRSMVGQDLQGSGIRFGGHRGYSTYSGGRGKTILGFAASPVTHIYDGIKEIMADYVHHDMTRTLILLLMRRKTLSSFFCDKPIKLIPVP